MQTMEDIQVQYRVHTSPFLPSLYSAYYVQKKPKYLKILMNEVKCQQVQTIMVCHATAIVRICR